LLLSFEFILIWISMSRGRTIELFTTSGSSGISYGGCPQRRVHKAWPRKTSALLINTKFSKYVSKF
jgi:hypothetical protein